MIGHTPGPWSVYRGEESAIGVGAMVDRLLVCRVDAPFTKRPNKEVNANARLIAAAPEMLTLLRGFAHAGDGQALVSLRKDTRTLLSEIDAPAPR